MFFFEEIKMDYINNNKGASEAQGVLKRTLKKQDVCQKLQNEHHPIPKQNKGSDRHCSQP
jgi:hypothetical protein